MTDETGRTGRGRWLETYAAAPADWGQHPRRKMLMTPWLVLLGGVFAFAVPTLVAAFFQIFFFHPAISDNWSPLSAAGIRGRQVYLANGCIYCHSGFTRPQDVRAGVYYIYKRETLPGEYATSDSGPNQWGTARIGPDLYLEAGVHPDDWETAHFNDPRFVEPLSIMPRFNFLTDQETSDLTTFLNERTGKDGLVARAGQIYMKKLFLLANNIPAPPTKSQAEKLTLKDVALEASNAPSPPSGNVDGLDWPDPINLNHVDRGYWLMSNPMPVTTDNLIRGRMIFQERCQGCHGQGGAAVSEAARFMSPMPIDFTHSSDAIGGNDTSPGDYYYRVLRGIHGSAMENFGTRLRVDDIWKVVLFLKTIPNGGLQQRVPTPEMYVQWQPPSTLLQYIAKHPIDANKDFTEYDQQSSIASAAAATPPSTPPTATASDLATGVITTDPFMLEARRVMAGLNDQDTFTLPGYGEISLQAAARDIKAIYEKTLSENYGAFAERGGYPAPTDQQKAALPDLSSQLR